MESKQWKNLAPMHHRRRNFALVFMEGYVYAIGGGWKYGLLDECEYYSVINDRWAMLSAMPYACKYPTAEVFNGKVFVYGLKKGTQYEYVLQVFTPSWRYSEGVMGGHDERKHYHEVNESCTACSYGTKWEIV